MSNNNRQGGGQPSAQHGQQNKPASAEAAPAATPAAPAATPAAPATGSADAAAGADSEPSKGEDTERHRRGTGNEKPQEARLPFHVVGPGAVHFGGKLLRAGATLLLTAEEAEDLEELVKEGKAPPPKSAIDRRVGGLYRVRGPGSVLHSGQFQAPGAVLELDQKDARTLGEAVEEVD